MAMPMSVRFTGSSFRTDCTGSGFVEPPATRPVASAVAAAEITSMTTIEAGESTLRIQPAAILAAAKAMDPQRRTRPYVTSAEGAVRSSRKVKLSVRAISGPCANAIRITIARIVWKLLAMPRSAVAPATAQAQATRIGPVRPKRSAAAVATGFATMRTRSGAASTIPIAASSRACALNQTGKKGRFTPSSKNRAP